MKDLSEESHQGPPKRTSIGGPHEESLNMKDPVLNIMNFFVWHN